MAQKELHVDEIKLQLAEKEQDLSELEAACNDIVLEAEKNDHIQAECKAILEQCRLQKENLDLREEKVAAREKAIKSFRKHGKGSRK